MATRTPPALHLTPRPVCDSVDELLADASGRARCASGRPASMPSSRSPANDGRNGWGAALLLRDVAAELVPVGDDPIPAAQHAAFLDHLAAMSART